MPNRFIRSVAFALLLSFLYSQNLYAFNTSFIPPSIPNPSLITAQTKDPTHTDKSSLIGAPISAGIGAGFQGGVNVGSNIIQAINNGLIRGATSLGIEYLTQKANLSPLLGSLTSRAITGAIEGALGGGNVFQGIFNAFKDSALNVARLGVSGTDSWSQAQYLQRVINFSDIIKTKGLAQAIEESAAQILHEDSISSILRSFNTVGDFFQDAIDNNKTETVIKDGKNYNRIQLPNGDWVDLDATKTNVDEFKIGGRILRGEFGRDEYGNFGLRTGVIDGSLDDIFYRQIIQEGKLTEIQIGSPEQGVFNPELKMEARNKEFGILRDTNGNIINGDLSIDFDYQEVEISETWLQEHQVSESAPVISSNPLSDFFHEIGGILNTKAQEYENFTAIPSGEFKIDTNLTDSAAGLKLMGSLFRAGFKQNEEIITLNGYTIRKQALIDFVGADVKFGTDLKALKFIEIGGKVYAAKVTLEAKHEFGKNFGVRFQLDGTAGSLGAELAIGKKMKLGWHSLFGASGTVEVYNPSTTGDQTNG